MTPQPSPHLPFDQKLAVVEDLVRRARVFLDLWWLLAGDESHKRVAPARDRYWEFFRFDQNAHFVAFTMYICQLFEKDPRSLHLSGLLDEAEEAGVTADAVAKARHAVESAAPLVSKIVKIRSNTIAHRSGKISYDDAFKRAEMTYPEMRRLTELGLAAINSLRSDLGKAEKAFREHPLEVFERLLQVLSPQDAREAVRPSEGLKPSS